MVYVMSKLWVFGHSFSQPFSLNENERYWAEYLSEYLGIKKIINCANAGSDNLYIFHNILKQQSNISKNDYVIVGWAPPGRKSFVYDCNNNLHQDLPDHDIIVYRDDPEFFRSYNKPKFWSLNSVKNFKNAFKKIKNLKFFDDWYCRYYSEYEAILNLTAYTNFCKQKFNTNYTAFYFSKDAIPLDESSDCFCALDFIIDQKVFISANDVHPNAHGHKLMADQIYQRINYQNILHSSK